MISIQYLLLVMAFSFLATLLAVPLVKRLAIRCKAMDKPNARKVHVHPIPLWGGLGMFFGFGITMLMVFRHLVVFQTALTPAQMTHIQGIMWASIGIIIVGLIDDRWGMPAKVKLACQLVLGCLLIAYDIKIDHITLPHFGIVNFPTWFTWAATLFWIAGITNALNLLDGLDGLLAGVSLTTALVFLVVSLFNGQVITAVVMAALAGSMLGFLRYNFNPAQIFMGDTGSLFLGLTFASWSIVGLMKSTATLAFFVPVFMMAVPIFDTAAAIVRRLLAGRPIFQADKEHLHHRLLRMGYTQRQVVLLIYCINTVFGLIGLALFYFTR